MDPTATTEPIPCAKEEQMFHLGMVKEMVENAVHEKCSGYKRWIRSIERKVSDMSDKGIDPAILALMQGNKTDVSALVAAANQGGFGGNANNWLPWLLLLSRGGFGGLNGDFSGAANGISPVAVDVRANADQLQNLAAELRSMSSANQSEHRVDAVESNLSEQLRQMAGEVNQIQRDQAAIAREAAACCCESQKETLKTQQQITLSALGTEKSLCDMERRLSDQMRDSNQDIKDQMSANEAAAVARHTQSIVESKNGEIQALRDRVFEQSQSAQTAAFQTQMAAMQQSIASLAAIVAANNGNHKS